MARQNSRSALRPSQLSAAAVAGDGERGHRLRLDEALVVRGLVASRSRARDLVLRGLVTVDGRIVAKPAAEVDPAVAALGLTDDGATAARLVSRGGEKLRAGLAAFGLDPAGRIALDVGASTGGFTQVLLEAGAARVYAVDVGHGQLDPRVAADPRVVAREGFDARDLGPECVPEPVGAIVADVSFISLAKALPAALALAEPGAWLIALVKPQFEAGREAVGRGGVVRDEGARQASGDGVRNWLAAQPGWRIVGLVPSPIVGGSGNAELLLGAAREP